MARSLKLADFVDGAIQHTKAYTKTFETFFFCFRGDDKEENFDKLIHDALKDLQREHSRIVAYFWQYSLTRQIKFLVQKVSPIWIIGDEIDAIQDVEFLIPIAANLDRVRQILTNGDAQQLPPVVLSDKKKNEDGNMTNEFVKTWSSPTRIIGDEIGVTQDAEFLIPIAANSNRVPANPSSWGRAIIAYGGSYIWHPIPLRGEP